MCRSVVEYCDGWFAGVPIGEQTIMAGVVDLTDAPLTRGRFRDGRYREPGLAFVIPSGHEGPGS
jgi:hypothetical protein